MIFGKLLNLSVPHVTYLQINILVPQFSTATQPCPTLCNSMDCSTPGFPVHRQLPELTQTHVLRVGDAMQPYHPLSSPSPPTFNLSQHQSFPMSQFFASANFDFVNYSQPVKDCAPPHFFFFCYGTYHVNHF